MSDYKRTNHTEWDCKYHIIFIPKYRKKVLYGKLRDRLGGVFRRLAHQKESEVEEGHLRVDHVHMMLSIPPKLARPSGRRELRIAVPAAARQRIMGVLDALEAVA